MSNEKQESLADIVADMRQGMNPNGTAECQYLESDICTLADRIEAAWKREKTTIEVDALAVGGLVEASHQRELFTKTRKNDNSGAAIYTNDNSGSAAKIQEALTYLEHVGQTKDGRVHFADIVNIGNAKSCLKDALSLLSKPAENDNNGDAVDARVNNETLTDIATAIRTIAESAEAWRGGVAAETVMSLAARIEAVARRAYNEIYMAVCSMGCVNIDNVRMSMNRTLGDYYDYGNH